MWVLARKKIFASISVHEIILCEHFSREIYLTRKFLDLRYIYALPLLQEPEKKSHSDYTAASGGEEQSIKDKRRQLLKQQRQKKMDTKIAMGLAPPNEEVISTILY